MVWQATVPCDRLPDVMRVLVYFPDCDYRLPELAEGAAVADISFRIDGFRDYQAARFGEIVAELARRNLLVLPIPA